MKESGSILSFHRDWWLPRVQPDVIEALSTQLPLSKPIAKVLYNRKIRTIKEASHFLHPSLDHLHDPFALPDMRAAVHRILRAVDGQERIVIYGHDDVDGVSSALVLCKVIESLGGNVRSYIPNRVAEGTGLIWSNLDLFARQGENLIVTVDCSVEDKRIISGIDRAPADIIVTDHHEVCHVIPQSIPFVNPKRNDASYPFRELAGVGVSFKVAQALIQTRGKVLEHFFNKIGDLVAFGTLADSVPLVNENRIFTKLGFDIFTSRPRPGFDALLTLFEEREPIQPELRIRQLISAFNSASTSGGQNDSLDLLVTEDPKQATQLAKELLESNREWRKVIEESFERILERVRREQSGKERAIVVIDDQTPPRVLGTCASKILRECQKPAFILSYFDDKYFGEARGPKGSNIVDILNLCQDLLMNYGGHKQAAGFSLFPEHIDDFRERLAELSKTMPYASHTPWRLDSELDVGLLNTSLLSQIDMLAPFGRGNPSPVFLGRDVPFTPIRVHDVNRNNKWIGTAAGCTVIASPQVADMWRPGKNTSSTQYDIIFHISTSDGHTPQIVLRDMRPTEPARKAKKQVDTMKK